MYKITLLCILVLSAHYTIGQMRFPQLRAEPVYDTLFGKVVPDPYRLLESKKPAVDEWVKMQEKLLRKHIQKDLKYYSSIYSNLLRNSTIDFEPLIKDGNSYYHYRFDSYHSSAALYRRLTYEGNDMRVVNPDKFERPGEKVSIQNFKVSTDNRYLAFALSYSGSDWREIRIMDLQHKLELDDVVSYVKYSEIKWYKDGFFYWRYDEPNEHDKLTSLTKGQRLFYHKVGTLQKNDSLVFVINESPFVTSEFNVTTDEKFLVLLAPSYNNGSWKDLLLLRDLKW